MPGYELKEKINETMSTNSINKANWPYKIFKEWLSNRQQNGLINGLHVFKAPEEMSKSELNSQLQYFFFEVHNVKGEKYLSNTLIYYRKIIVIF